MARKRSATIDSIAPLQALLDQYSDPTPVARVATDDPEELRNQLEQLETDITAIAGIAKHYLGRDNGLAETQT